jgi:hypothetical protein
MGGRIGVWWWIRGFVGGRCGYTDSIFSSDFYMRLVTLGRMEMLRSSCAFPTVVYIQLPAFLVYYNTLVGFFMLLLYCARRRQSVSLIKYIQLIPQSEKIIQGSLSVG